MAKKRSILEKTTVDDSRGTQKDEKQRGDETKRSPKEGKEAEGFVVAEESGTSSKRLRMAESITAEDVEQLIDDARNCALALSTGNPEWRSESPPACEFEKGAEEGSRKDASGSQEFHQKMHGLVTALLAGGRKELRVGSLGQFVVDALMMLEKMFTPSCRPRSKAGSVELFPIPVLTLHCQAGHVDLFLQAVVGSLNSLHSPGEIS